TGRSGRPRRLSRQRRLTLCDRAGHRPRWRLGHGGGVERIGMPEFVVEFGKDGAPPDDGRLDAAAFHRNHAAIAPVLEAFLQDRSGDVLEIGAGTGQHAVAFASKLPAITWWPTDFNDNHLPSIAAWRKHAQLENVQ